jgi:hypothetical protein
MKKSLSNEAQKENKISGFFIGTRYNDTLDQR